MKNDQLFPTYFLSHGGGPWPWLQGPFRDAMETLKISLEKLPQELPGVPQAILIISGHWEEEHFKVSSHPHPPMVYDYYGFPEHTYHIKYEAPGSPALAQQVKELIELTGEKVSLDHERGFDHGTFVPLAVSYPEAQIPVVQLSLHSNYDPELHFKIGKALSPLRSQGVLIIGSGLSYHNLRLFNAQARIPSREFDQWLQEVLLHSPEEERLAKLKNWEKAPSARLAHPREDHLIPLMVALGAAANEKAHLTYHEDDLLGGISVSSFRFGDSLHSL